MSLLARFVLVVVLALSAAGDAFAFAPPGRDVVTSARISETAIQASAAQGSPQHPFWLRDAGWTNAGDLVVGDQVLSASGGWLRVGSSTWMQERATVYNFKVADYHSYFVGELGAWVHNANYETVDIVYRVIRGDQDPLVGIFAKDLNATYALEAHVTRGSYLKTQFVSATRDLAVAEEWAAASGNRIIAFDLNAVSGKVYDLSHQAGRLAHLKGIMSRNFARKSAEVVIAGHIPAGAIKWVRP